MCLIDLEVFYPIYVWTYIGFLSKFCIVAQYFASIKDGDGSYLKNKLEPYVLELHIMPLLEVFGLVESISQVTFLVQGQDQMLNNRWRSKLTFPGGY